MKELAQREKLLKSQEKDIISSVLGQFRIGWGNWRRVVWVRGVIWLYPSASDETTKKKKIGEAQDEAEAMKIVEREARRCKVWFQKR